MSSKEPINSKKEGSIDINGEYLSYAVLQDNQFVIVQSSLYSYLEINTKSQEYIFFPTENDNQILYNAKSGEPEIGISIADLVAYCLGLCDSFAHEVTGIYKKAIELISFLTAIGLNQLIHEENLKPVIEEKSEPTFEDLIEGLLRVPPPTKKKK